MRSCFAAKIPCPSSLDDAALPERRDRGLVVAELAQDKISMLAERGRTRRDLAGRFGQADGGARHWCGLRQAGIVDVLHEAGGADVRMIERLLRAQHGA